MYNFPVKKQFKSVVRWFVLISLLSGMFFSSGEGIRLLPFPSSNFTNNSIENSSQNETPTYVSSVQNLNKNRAKYAMKFQKQLKDSVLKPSFSIIHNLEEYQAFYLQNTGNFKELLNFPKSPALLLPPGRAPPIV